MKRDLSTTVMESDGSSYSQETKLCENIIGAGVVLFLTCLIICGILVCFTSYKKVREPKEYVVQSAFIEIQP